MNGLSLLLTTFLALVIPIVMARFKVTTVPTAVAEIIVGIIMGQSALNLVTINSQLTFLSNLGVIILMFLSGMEIDFDLLKPSRTNRSRKSEAGKEVKPLLVAGLAFVGVAVFAVGLALIMKAMGLFSDVALATIIFMTVALGVVIATLKEKEILSRPIGQTVLLTAVLGEVIPLLLLTIYSSINGGDAKKLWLIVLLFAAAIFLLRRFKQPYNWFSQVTKATTQLDIRLAFFLIFALVTVAEQVGAENILGAFLAGMVMKLLEPSQATKDKLTSIGYGFFIPIFFIKTGVNLNLKLLFANPQALALLPVLVICFFLAKAPVTLVYMRYFNKRNAFAGGFLTATTITIVLPTLQVARKLKAITSTQSSAFILAAVIVCIVCPIVFNSTFKLTPADKIKEKVTILGLNTLTTTVFQDLHDSWYSVEMLTCKEENYNTYKSKIKQLQLLPDASPATIEKADGFDTDIFVAAYHDDEINYKAALAAKRAGVKRVIARQRQAQADVVDQLRDEGIEVFAFNNVRGAMLRALIESPAVYRIITDTNNALYDVVVKNPLYTGRMLMDWDFIDEITISRIRRGNKWISPHGSTVIEPGDELVFSGPWREADRIHQILSQK
ncbi:monovalent cation:proton antiporter family protein [Lactobacillus equicursoris]|uniref:monovalent cation:proton antiporter family protein n=1 Tax=Lactobacillus equicursoris TaxID=420645 RepID=UPI0024306C61|nr:cation:proton antiporter [Lactobacillus equicursoris]MDD6386138.1 cation:proton antiporter [Lactobacillus equicursoris]